MRTILKTVKKVLYLSTGKRSWQVFEYFDPKWTSRIEEMSKYIEQGSSVLDLGCGKMWLKQYLNNNTYFPVDYTDRGTGTIVCDFNKKDFPDVKAQTAFVSGTLEYVVEAKWFLDCISRNCDACVISYCTLEDYSDLNFRKRQSWVNNFSREEIIDLFKQAGFSLIEEN